jgi:hypothetical protein
MTLSVILAPTIIALRNDHSIAPLAWPRSATANVTQFLQRIAP